MTNNTLLATVPIDLMYQALETEKGGVQIYTTALRLAINKDLREEWNKYLEQTKNHVQVLSNIITELAQTLCVVISKSGGTKETRNGMLEAQTAYQKAGLSFAKHAVAVTGAGS